ncbi:general substrate transporter [Aspergillus welwitschiae]|uniref:General substrate transporter n=1 Tax=Aspergillus welwitschiae TaxID=1341132 RepID=A0A3F3PKW3_9EURO|nr:general substrate transporter [Aspergillus welwitschiae]RDH27575.1 general substrate transporter [Aspergillus welwitschiae]
MTEPTSSPIHWPTFFTCVLISFGQFVGAYESVIIGTTLEKPDFMQRMGLWDSDGNETARYGSLEGAIVGLFQAGAIFGTIISAIVMTKWGRKAGLAFGSIISLAGLGGMTGSMNVAEFLVFRFISGFGTWACGAAASVAIPELSPPSHRGLYAGLNGVMIGLGVATASYVGMGFYFCDNEAASWRAPMGIPLFAPIAVLLAMPFVPESPRYLLLQDRPDAAKRVFDKLNPRSGTPAHDTYVDEEFSQIKQQAAYDRMLDSSWKGLFTTPTYLRRIILGCTLAVLNQSTGVFVINNYGQTFYSQLGFSPSASQLLQGNRDIIAFLGNFVGSWIVDRIGRKAILLFAFFGCFTCVLLEGIMVALYAESDNSAGKNAGVAFIYLFLVFYGTGIDVGTYVYLGEMFPNHIRVKGVGLSLAAMNVASTIYLSVTSTAVASIGWKFFLVFAVITFLGMILIAVFFPETRGLPLEEIEALFGNDQAIVTFTSTSPTTDAGMGDQEKGMAEHVEA